MTNLSDREQLKEAVESVQYLFDRNIITKKCCGVITGVLESHLSASEELPEDINGYDFYSSESESFSFSEGFREYKRQVTPIVARKDIEIDNLKSELAQLQTKMESMSKSAGVESIFNIIRNSDFFCKSRTPTHEDIHKVATEIHDSIMGEK